MSGKVWGLVDRYSFQSRNTSRGFINATSEYQI